MEIQRLFWYLKGSAATKPTHFDFLPGKWGYHRQGSCQAGLGGAIDQVNRNINAQISPPLLHTILPGGLLSYSFLSKLASEFSDEWRCRKFEIFSFQSGDQLFVGAVGSWYWQGMFVFHQLTLDPTNINSTQQSIGSKTKQ